MKIFVTALIFAASIALPGCAPSTAVGVRDMGKAREYSFIASANYQPLYRKILTQQKKCYEASGLSSGQIIVTGELYHDILLGTITTTQYAGYGVNVWQVIDLRAVDEKNTEVTIHVALEPVERVGHRLKEWALTEYKDCLFRN